MECWVQVQWCSEPVVAPAYLPHLTPLTATPSSASSPTPTVSPQASASTSSPAQRVSTVSVSISRPCSQWSQRSLLSRWSAAAWVAGDNACTAGHLTKHLGISLGLRKGLLCGMKLICLKNDNIISLQLLFSSFSFSTFPRFFCCLCSELFNFSYQKEQ